MIVDTTEIPVAKATARGILAELGAERVLAATACSETFSQEQCQTARAVARFLGVRHLEPEAFLAFGYTYVTLDLAGFRGGSLNEALAAGRSTAEIGSV